MDERYPPGTERPEIDWELWRMGARDKYHNGEGQEHGQQLSDDDDDDDDSCSCQSTVSSHKPARDMAAEFVTKLCNDSSLLRKLFDGLKAVNSDLSTKEEGATSKKRKQPEQEEQKEVLYTPFFSILICLFK